jgi:hypothetical protein
VICGEESFEGRFKIEVEEDFADIEEEVGHGNRNFKF